jgi:hypothetical protein
MADAPFFIGWSSKPPRALFGFLFASALLIVAVAAIAGFAIGATAADPGGGEYTFPELTLTGVIAEAPYPILRIAADADHPAHAIMLSTEGTNGAEGIVAGLAGRRVSIRGLLIKRGDLDMFEIAGGGITAAAPPANAPAVAPTNAVPLGRWRITGEICDGKCYTGAMRPGSGLAHKACAGICFTGGVPAVFVSTRPIAGQSFMLMVDAKSGKFIDAFHDLAALLIAIDGNLERIDDLLVFRVDPATAKVL